MGKLHAIMVSQAFGIGITIQDLRSPLDLYKLRHMNAHLGLVSTKVAPFNGINYFNSSREILGCRRHSSFSFTGMTDSAFTFFEPDAQTILLIILCHSLSFLCVGDKISSKSSLTSATSCNRMSRTAGVVIGT